MRVPVSCNELTNYKFSCYCKTTISTSELAVIENDQSIKTVRVPISDNFKYCSLEFHVSSDFLILLRTSNSNNSMFVDNLNLTIL